MISRDLKIPKATLIRRKAEVEEHLLEDGCDVKRRYGDGVLSAYVSPYVTGQGQEGRGGLLGPEPLLSQQVAREEM